MSKTTKIISAVVGVVFILLLTYTTTLLKPISLEVKIKLSDTKAEKTEITGWEKELDAEDFEALKKKIEAAGYEVKKAYLDSSFKYVEAINVKVPFDEHSSASIPIALTESEADAKFNCDLLGYDGIKAPVYEKNLFSYPGKDYPNRVLELIDAIIQNKEIPQNPYPSIDSGK